MCYVWSPSPNAICLWLINSIMRNKYWDHITLYLYSGWLHLAKKANTFLYLCRYIIHCTLTSKIIIAQAQKWVIPRINSRCWINNLSKYSHQLFLFLTPALVRSCTFLRFDSSLQYADMSLAVCNCERQRHVNKFALHALSFMNWNE